MCTYPVLLESPALPPYTLWLFWYWDWKADVVWLLWYWLDKYPPAFAVALFDSFNHCDTFRTRKHRIIRIKPKQIKHVRKTNVGLLRKKHSKSKRDIEDDFGKTINRHLPRVVHSASANWNVLSGIASIATTNWTVRLLIRIHGILIIRVVTIWLWWIIATCRGLKWNQYKCL